MTAIDLGSNTFRAVRLDCENLEPVAVYEKIVRTADGLVETGRIAEAAVARIVAAAKEAKERVGFGDGVAAVGTEAVRRAANAAEVLARIEKEAGLRFRVIDGAQEAAYTLLAVRTRLKKLGLESERFVLVDIGGGSTEVLFFDEGRVHSESFPLGIVTVAQKYGSLGRIAEALEEKTAPIRVHLEEAKAQGFRPRLFVPTAGTPTTVAAMKLGMTYATYDPARINGTVVTREDLQVQLARLLSLDEKARQKLVGVGREDLIAAGILIFDKLYGILGFDEAVVIDDGLREGVAIAECRQLSGGEILT
ncbi:Ppx/GppA phosphatase family protein [Hydrogenimonas sp.]